MTRKSRDFVAVTWLATALLAARASCREITVHNNCETTKSWAIDGTWGVASPARSLGPGETSVPIVLEHGWSGRLWDNSTQTHANTLAEFTIDDVNNDYYDISIVDGYDTGLRITPSAEDCSVVQCSFDVAACPGDLIEYEGGPCLSACSKYAVTEFCCTGDHNTHETCPPNELSVYFKSLCPDAYTYAFDDPTSLHTCGHALSYTVTLCPT